MQVNTATLPPTSVPIAVDLDGCLVHTDTLHESAVFLLRIRPLQLLSMPFWLLQGKATMKEKLNRQAPPHAESLPYNAALLEWLRIQKANGRKLVLCTASDLRTARAVADHLNIFDEVFASDGKTNLAGKNKRAVLEEHFGERGFDYVGNSSADLEVWAGARKAILVNTSAGVALKAAKTTEVEKTINAARANYSAWWRVLRLHQWLKNILLCVPLLAAHQLSASSLLLLAVAFLSFGLCASSVYITNDLLDLESDRNHPHKKNRPFAAGTVAIWKGAALAPVLAIAGIAVAALVGERFLAWIVGYMLLSGAYSAWLKRLVLIDCLTLAGLYTLRITAGAAAVGVALSFWLLAFSIFLFLSLAFVKRYAELRLQEANGKDRAQGRGYYTADAPLVQMLGVTAGYAAVLVLALYIRSEAVMQLYQRPEVIWAAVPLLLFWVSWVWMKAHRGQMHDDPIVFAMRDKASAAVGLLLAATFVFATQ